MKKITCLGIVFHFFLAFLGMMFLTYKFDLFTAIVILVMCGSFAKIGELLDKLNMQTDLNNKKNLLLYKGEK